MNGFEVKVLNGLNEVMFTAKVSYIYVTAFQTEVKPFIKTIEMVEPGTGNAGKKQEYFCTYDCNSIDYLKFIELMNNIDLR